MKKIPFVAIKMTNILLLLVPFLACWMLYYEKRTTTVGSKQVAVLVMFAFFAICYYFCQRLDCFRVSILQIRDIAFGQILATMITDVIMYESRRYSIQLMVIGCKAGTAAEISAGCPGRHQDGR